MAEDSAIKTEEKQAIQNSPATSEIVICKGIPATRIRGNGGKFEKQPKAMPSSREFTRVTRNYMLKMEAGKDGKITKNSQTKYEMMCENMICIARGVETILKDGTIVIRDAKADMAAAQAFKIVTERGLGQAPKNDEELDALKTQAVRIVIIQPPKEFMNKEVREDTPRPELKPAFLDAEFSESKT